MVYIILLLLAAALAAAAALYFRFTKYDRQGFDKKGFHKNGTKYDDDGYDYFGYDRNGYNRQGYNTRGRNARGQYDRFYDIKDFQKGCFSADGFLDPRDYPVAVTNHARSRMQERMGIHNRDQMEALAFEAYRFGRSARQLPGTSAALVRDIEGRQENSVVLLYRNYVYIFSVDNVLITVYKNDNIRL